MRTAAAISKPKRWESSRGCTRHRLRPRNRLQGSATGFRRTGIGPQRSIHCSPTTGRFTNWPTRSIRQAGKEPTTGSARQLGMGVTDCILLTACTSPGKWVSPQHGSTEWISTPSWSSSTNRAVLTPLLSSHTSPTTSPRHLPCMLTQAPLHPGDISTEQASSRAVNGLVATPTHGDLALSRPSTALLGLQA